LDGPVTKASNVNRGCRPRGRRGGGRLLLGRLDHQHLDLEIRSADLEEGVAEQGQIALVDPLAEKLGVDPQHEAIVGEGEGPGPREGELVRLAVERRAQPLADLLPDGVALEGRGGES